MSGASRSMATGSPGLWGQLCSDAWLPSQQAQRGIKCEESFPFSWSLSLETAHLSLHGLACPFRPPLEWA